MQLTSPTETDLWRSNLDALRWAVTLRKPDAVARLRLQVEKLDNEVSTLVLRRSFVAASGAWPLFDDLTDQLNALLGRMDDLKAIGDLVRSSPLDHDDGANPEAALKANGMWDGDGNLRGFRASDPGTDDLSDDLKRAASDIQHGWAAITKGAAVAISGRSQGGYDIGTKAEVLAKQYQAWVQELHRKRIGTWSFDDVVCNGLSRAECAMKRRCHPEAVYAQLVEGLSLYADRFGPLSD